MVGAGWGRGGGAATSGRASVTTLRDLDFSWATWEPLAGSTQWVLT